MCPETPQTPEGQHASLVLFVAKWTALLLVPWAYVYFYNGGVIGAVLLGTMLVLSGAFFAAIACVVAVCGVFLQPLLVPFLSGISGREAGLLLFLLGVAAWVMVPSKGFVDARWRARACGSRLRMLLWGTAVLCAVSMAFRSVPGFAALGWALLAGAAAASLPSRPQHASFGIQMATAALTLVSLLLGLSILEIGARLILPPPGSSSDLYFAHPEYIFLLNPNSSGEKVVELTDGTTFTKATVISEQGIRDRVLPPKQPDEYRVLLLGDSFAMGRHLSPEDCISARIEGHLSELLPGKTITVANGGIGGGGPLQYLGMWRTYGVPLHPDLVVLQTFPGNDIDNSLEVVGKRLRAYWGNWHGVLNGFIYRNYPQFRLERMALLHCRLYDLVVRTLGGGHITRFCNALRFFPEPAMEQLIPSEPRPPYSEINLAEWYPELDEGFALFGDYVHRLREEVEATGAEFMVFAVPELSDVSDDAWDRTLLEAENAEYVRWKGLRRVEGFFDSADFRWLSLLDALRDGGPPEKLYFLLNRHLTPKGSDLVAQAIATYLVEEGVIGQSSDISTQVQQNTPPAVD